MSSFPNQALQHRLLCSTFIFTDPRSRALKRPLTRRTKKKVTASRCRPRKHGAKTRRVHHLNQKGFGMGGGLDLVLKTEREKGNLRVHQPSKWRPGAATKSHQPHLNGPLGCSSTGQQRAGTGRERAKAAQAGEIGSIRAFTNHQQPVTTSSFQSIFKEAS